MTETPSRPPRPVARAPAQVSALLRELAAQLPVILGRNLVGIYLYGSLTQRAFDPRRRDVDLIVVTLRDLSDAQFRKVGACFGRSCARSATCARRSSKSRRASGGTFPSTAPTRF